MADLTRGEPVIPVDLEDAVSPDIPEAVNGSSKNNVQSVSHLVMVDSNGKKDERSQSEHHGNELMAKLKRMSVSLKHRSKISKRAIRITVIGLLFMLYNALLIYACVRNFEKAKTLLIITIIVYVVAIYCNFISDLISRKIVPLLAPVFRFCSRHRRIRRRIQAALFLVSVAIFLGFDCASNPRRLQSLAGVFGLILFGWLISKHPFRVPWYTVLWGMAIQVIFALIILRWESGRAAFDFIGAIFQGLIEFTNAGSEFVFGSNYKEHFFAFGVCPVIIFFGFLIAAMYYWGAMQWIIVKIGWLLYVVMGTSACESFCAAANIFIGMTEAPLMVKPYLDRMTVSELHCLFVGGFANVAGSVLAAYISFGVSAVHLLSASVMSAPATLALSKLVYPETEVTRTGAGDINFDKGPEQNVLEAASLGATAAVKLVSSILANIIATLAALAMFNWMLSYFGDLIGIQGLSFEFICGYIFIPLAWAMGADWQDSQKVAVLVGKKTFLNEFIAYVDLGEMIKNRTITPRSELVATYALCGFSNIASLGIMIGGMCAMAPTRKSDIVNVGVRSLICGSMSCFMVASVASLLVDTESTGRV